MPDFTNCPVVDDHCHVLEPEKKTIEPIWLAREFFHGIADTPIAGVTKSQALGRDRRPPVPLPPHGRRPDDGLPARQALRLRAHAGGGHRRAEPPDGGGGTRRLREDALCGCRDRLLRHGLQPPDQRSDPRPDPGQEDPSPPDGPAPRKLLESSGSYAELLKAFQAGVEKSIRQDGFVGIKSHLGERVGFGAAPVEADEAERYFSAAKAGDGEAYKKIYMAVCAGLA